MRQLEYTTGDVNVQSKEFTEVFSQAGGEKIRLMNQHDNLEFLNYSISLLITAMVQLNTAIDSLRDDIRQIRVGNEAFVYGAKVAESDDVDAEDLQTEEGEL